MSHILGLIQFTSCSARKLESIANQTQLVLVLASWICLLSCNNMINTACLAWHLRFYEVHRNSTGHHLQQGKRDLVPVSTVEFAPHVGGEMTILK
jgi:hypothetical protein